MKSSAVHHDDQPAARPARTVVVRKAGMPVVKLRVPEVDRQAALAAGEFAVRVAKAGGLAQGIDGAELLRKVRRGDR